MVSHADVAAMALTLKLAAITTGLLLGVGVPLAWWLARTSSISKTWVAAIVGLPLVLPPTVIGFYLLILLGPHGAGGKLTQALGLGTLPFTFGGLVVGSALYSLPFVVQPLQNAFEIIGVAPLEVAAMLGAGPWDRFFTVALPLARPGLVVATILSFAHTIGEFGIVLMLGGNIPDKTQVLSVALYDHVESFQYEAAHRLAGLMVVFSFVVLLTLHTLRARRHPL